MGIKSAANGVFRRFGFQVYRVSSRPQPGQDPLYDMRQFVLSEKPLIFDVGANVGQSIAQFRDNFPHSAIHAFEPGTATFSELKRRVDGVDNLHLNNLALGSRPEEREFIENAQPEMSSFLEAGPVWWGAVARKSLVRIRTVDDYCKEMGISHIDILKSDTQGFDLEVLRGAKHLLMSQRVHMVFLEVTFSEIYKGLPRPDAILGFLLDHGFSLVSFYRLYHLHGIAGWTDALFVNPRYECPPHQGAGA